jgi:hypothetical protein
MTLPRIRIDYQTQPRPRWPGWALLVLAAVVGVDLALTRIELEQQLATWETPKSALPGKGSVATVRDPTAGKTPSFDAQIEEAAGVLAQLKTPWSALFRSIEAAHGDEVALLGLQPDIARHSLSIVGEAKEYGDALAYVARLRNEAKLANAHLVGNEVKEDDPQRPVLFTVSANWKAVR